MAALDDALKAMERPKGWNLHEEHREPSSTLHLSLPIFKYYIIVDVSPTDERRWGGWSYGLSRLWSGDLAQEGKAECHVQFVLSSHSFGPFCMEVRQVCWRGRPVIFGERYTD